MASPSSSTFHPVERILDGTSLPSPWCAGCGIGTTVYALASALYGARLGAGDILLLSGSGCTGHAADHFTSCAVRSRGVHLLDLAADRKLMDPRRTVIALMGNADLLVSGAEDLLRITKRRVQIVVIHVNNFIYVTTKAGFSVNTPYRRLSRDQRFELPFNMPAVAMSCGVNYVARWTPLHAGWLKYSIVEALSNEGVSFIEVISPCLLYDGSERRIGQAFEKIRFFDDAGPGQMDEPYDEFDIRRPAGLVIGKILDKGIR